MKDISVLPTKDCSSPGFPVLSTTPSCSEPRFTVAVSPSRPAIRRDPSSPAFRLPNAAILSPSGFSRPQTLSLRRRPPEIQG
jgi:hypothetical protein